MASTDLCNIELTEVFLPLLEDKKRYKVYYGGRGGGKSIAFAQCILLICLQKKTRVLCAREFQNSIEDSVHELFCELIELYNLSSKFIIKNNTIETYNKSKISFAGLSRNIESIKSKQGIDICWIEEAETVSDKSWELLLPSVRGKLVLRGAPKTTSQLWISFNPKIENNATYERFVTNKSDDDDDYILEKVLWSDNPHFPDDLEKERLACKRDYPTRYNWIWQGEFQQGDDDAVWKYKDYIRVDGSGSIQEIKERYGIRYIAISVDPAVSYSDRSDSTGIMVGGIGNNDLLYLIADLTIHAETNEWMHLIHNTYVRYDADIIIAEKNQGGDLIENNLKLISKHINYEGVTAVKDKILRANGIIFLYRDQLVRHLEGLEELENEQCTYTGGKNEKSPDRMDAAVHLLKFLSVKIQSTAVKIMPSKPTDTVINRVYGDRGVAW